MPPIYLHIGLGKTGTTACQQAFESGRCALRQGGLLYPETGIKAAHHFKLAEAFIAARAMPADTRTRTLAALRAELDAARLPALISSEHFSDAADADIAGLVTWFGGDVTVIVTLRNQVAWASAMYFEAIRWGHRMTFVTFLERAAARMDYEGLVGRWSRIVGRERMRVIAYDRVRDGIVAAVLRAADQPRAAATIMPPLTGHVHPTLTAPLVHLLFEISENAKGQVLEPALWRLEAELTRRGRLLPRHWRVPDAFQGAFLAHDAANERLAADHALPSPLFGKSLIDILARNRKEGYAARSVVEWLMGEAVGREPAPQMPLARPRATLAGHLRACAAWLDGHRA